MLLTFVAGCEHDESGGAYLARPHLRSSRHELLDVGELHDPDLTRNDEVRAADVEVVPAATREVFELPAGTVLAEIKLEAYPGEAVQQVFVELSCAFGDQGVALLRELERHRSRDQVGVL